MYAIRSYYAAPYLYLIIREIEQRQMPMELVLLPIVESAYNPNARSHGNAVGLWQFLSATGQQYGVITSYSIHYTKLYE